MDSFTFRFLLVSLVEFLVEFLGDYPDCVPLSH